MTVITEKIKFGCDDVCDDVNLRVFCLQLKHFKYFPGIRIKQSIKSVDCNSFSNEHN